MLLLFEALGKSGHSVWEVQEGAVVKYIFLGSIDIASVVPCAKISESYL